LDEKLSQWKEALRKPVHVDGDHLIRFKQQLKRNVPKGWNKKPGPYIPNGSATLLNKVKDGGNWNREVYSSFCRAVAVISSGKPRIVTCYSAHNTSVLTPLHNSLYEVLGRKGWLLIGDPTAERVSGLNGDGNFLSFDYVGATDNIKSAYTKAAVEVLVEQSEDLSWDEERCLRVLSELRLIDHDEVFERGQPMGSAMSFPLLCLINKTVVDLSLNDLLTAGVIKFNVWTQHRCLINGDDLLIKEPHRKSNLKDAIIRNGSAVGLIVNEEKSMDSVSDAEINSTLFTERGTVREKKTNANALYMKPDVSDVLGLAREATVTLQGFKRVVRANAGLLARQEDKQLFKLPYPYQTVCRKDRKIKKALMSSPISARPSLANLFPITDRPDRYDLSREEEVAVLRDRVEAIRKDAIEFQIAKQAKEKFKTKVRPCIRSWRSLIRRKKATERETILTVLCEAFWKKEKQKLVEEDGLAPSYLEIGDMFHDESLYPNKISYLIDAIRGYQVPKPKPCAIPPQVDLGCHLEEVFVGRARLGGTWIFDKREML
jgi:hypothetical protein